jgi:glutamine amidotransferase
MCRHLAHVGAPVALRTLLLDAPHALVRQAEAPREMVVAVDNPDGWGVAWWTSPRLAPLQYRSTHRMWDDTGFAFGDERSGAVIAAVRKASPGMQLRSENNAPFVAPASRLGPLAFSLNGHAFHESCKPRVLAALRAGTELAGDTDSEAVFALVRDRIDSGADPATAVAAVHHLIAPGPEVYVNLLLTRPTEIVATTWQHTLYARHTADGVTVASEPLDDDPAWDRVPDGHLLSATPTTVHWEPLEGLRP